jgi:hypothetical protein
MRPQGEDAARRNAANTLSEVTCTMVRWNVTFKAVFALGALASLLVLSGAGLRWGEFTSVLSFLF